jgi:hypothetical protein
MVIRCENQLRGRRTRRDSPRPLRASSVAQNMRPRTRTRNAFFFYSIWRKSNEASPQSILSHPSFAILLWQGANRTGPKSESTCVQRIEDLHQSARRGRSLARRPPRQHSGGALPLQRGQGIEQSSKLTSQEKVMLSLRNEDLPTHSKHFARSISRSFSPN